jgi:protein-S-isoprenylcysteine O-methyltransferase Ste14
MSSITVPTNLMTPGGAAGLRACYGKMRAAAGPSTHSLVRLIRFLAIAVLAFEAAVPVYWLILHAPVGFWRRHIRLAFLVAVAAAWGITDSLLYRFRFDLFRAHSSLWLALAGLAMIAFDVFTSSKSEGTLGGMRIVGHAELAGSRELIVRGLYARVRHPRYLGMMAGVFGACLIVASPLLWQASVLWLALALFTIRAEERELRARLGPAYVAYAEQVPALVPLRLRSRRKQPGSPAAQAGREP